MPDAPLPADALFVPEALKTGDNVFERTASITGICEPLLGVDLRGRRACIYPAPAARRAANVRHQKSGGLDQLPAQSQTRRPATLSMGTVP